MRFRLFFCVLPLLLGVGACTSSDDDDLLNQAPFGGLRGINALADLQDVSFEVVFQDFDPSVSTRLFFQTSSPLVDFSERNYTFTFSVTLPGDDEITVLSETTGTILPETLYDYVIAGTLDDPQLLVWVQPRRDWLTELLEAEAAGTQLTELVVGFGHAAVNAGMVDVYLEAPGADPAASTPVATLAFGDLADPITIEEGTYQLTLTAAGDPATVIFSSDDIEVLGANTALFTVVEDGGFTTQQIGVQLYVESAAQSLVNLNATGAISVVHAVPEATAVDVFDSVDFDNPLVSALAFGELSSDVEFASGEIDLSITPAGDVGVVLAQASVELPEGAYRRLFLAGEAGEVQAFVVEDDRRSLQTQGRLRGFNGSVRFETVDVFLLAPGADLESSPTAISNLGFGVASTLATLDPGEFELVLTEVDSTNVIFGPMDLVVEAGDVVELVVVDAAESTTADVIILQTAGD